MKTLAQDGSYLPMWLSLAMMGAGCVGLVVTAFAWTFGEGPLPTPWFMALFTLCGTLVAVGTTPGVMGWAFWLIMIVSFNTVMYLSHTRTTK
jgi:hypothetical protein